MKSSIEDRREHSTEEQTFFMRNPDYEKNEGGKEKWTPEKQ